MDFTENRHTLIATVAAGALVAGIGGVLLGRTLFAPAGPTSADATTAAAPSSAKSREGFVEMDAAKAKAAGIVTEAAVGGTLGAEIIAQGIVAATPEGEAALTARADGAVTRISKRLGDYVSAGEAVAYLESRDASLIAAERSTASAKLAAARAAYAREKRLFDAKVTARQDLEAAQAVLAEAEAEARRTRSAASAAKISGDGHFLAVTSLISGRITKVDTQLGAYVLAGAELFRVADPRRVQVNASVLPADAQRISVGDKAVIELPGGTTTTATVRSATPGLDSTSRTATLVLNPDSIMGLTPGQGLRVRVTPRATSPAGAIALPDEAVQSVEGRDVVFVHAGNGFQAKPVSTGMRSGGRIEILSGIEPGMVIVTKGAFLLKAELGKGEGEE